VLVTCLSDSATVDPVAVARQTISGSDLMQHQVAQFDDQEIASHLLGARNPLQACQASHSFVGTTARNEIFRRDSWAEYNRESGKGEIGTPEHCMLTVNCRVRFKPRDLLSVLWPLSPGPQSSQRSPVRSYCRTKLIAASLRAVSHASEGHSFSGRHREWATVAARYA